MTNKRTGNDNDNGSGNGNDNDNCKISGADVSFR
jgi:hypothetical protein